jgi:2-methylisocitrate lyase-like PEP mutase family enzyme
MIHVGLGNVEDIAAGLKTLLAEGYNGTSIEDTLGPYIDGLAAEPQIADLFRSLELVCDRTFTRQITPR